MHIECEILRGDLPDDCVADCSAPGQDASDAVSYWRRRLDLTVNRDRAIRCLTGYGAWDDLETWDDARLAETVLWLACANFSEFDVNPGGGSDVFCLE